jgi:hypothetical protein
MRSRCLNRDLVDRPTSRVKRVLALAKRAVGAFAGVTVDDLGEGVDRFSGEDAKNGFDLPLARPDGD